MEKDCKGREYEDFIREGSRKPDQDLLGKEFGLLKVVKYVRMVKTKRGRWLCECECGNLTCVDGPILLQGRTRSCGCEAGQFAAEKLKEDLLGKTFGRLTVVGSTFDKEEGHTLWECECQCGKVVFKRARGLVHGNVRSCGCLHADTIREITQTDLVGKRFGILTVLSREEGKKRKDGSIRSAWKCHCDCGQEIVTLQDTLIAGKIKSCGCLTSLGELHIKQVLEENNINYLPQKTFPELTGVKGGFLRYDFAILNEEDKVVRLIEFDGPQHNEGTNWGDYEKTHEHDRRKNLYAYENNIPLVRIPYSYRDKITLDILLGDNFLYKGGENQCLS